MHELTCIVCPIGCSLLVEISENENRSVPNAAFTVKGNRCKRGAVYAQEEIRAPKRVVTATVAIDSPAEEHFLDTYSATRHHNLTAPRRLPVKTSVPCPKDKINELLEDIYRLKIGLPVKTGQKLIEDWKGLNIDVIAVRNFE